MRTKKTWLTHPLTIAVAACIAAACTASAGDNKFNDDDDDGSTSNSGASSSGDLGITGGGTTGGADDGVIKVEPKCDGIDPSIDNDGDGWTGAAGDCNDCTKEMNPGAQDYAGNNIDDDCNGAKDDNPTLCDGALPLDASNPQDAAKAMGLCKMQGGDPERWGLISAQYILADGTPFFEDPVSYGIVSKFGLNVNPQEGKQMLVLSSGAARNPTDPGYGSPSGYSKGYSSGTPSGYPKESPSCPGVQTGIPYDSVGLRIQVKTPTNAKSLRFNLNFYTYEFPNFICSSYNDFMVAMLSPIPAGAPDGNISYDSKGNTISVNAGFLRACHAQDASNGVFFPCDLGPGELAGTGFDDGTNSAGTSWLQTSAALADPGSIIELDFAIWDSGDGILDSTVLLDNFGFVVNETPTETIPVAEPK
ncbi:MAG: hypothetical protein HUU21_11795 [Polyangiaceae bacterium]|nr:hypothetical protein [Polyangiaceae bacterium]